jgi:hypothetical protein
MLCSPMDDLPICASSQVSRARKPEGHQLLMFSFDKLGISGMKSILNNHKHGEDPFVGTTTKSVRAQNSAKSGR